MCQGMVLFVSVEVTATLLYNHLQIEHLEICLAKTVIALIITLLISASLHPHVFAAEIVKPKPKSDPSGGLSLSSTVGSYFFAGSEQRNIAQSYGIKVGYEAIEKSVADSLGIEGTLNYFSARSKVDSSNDSGYLYRLDVTYPFPINKKWMPFIAFGVGGIAIDSTANSGQNFLLNYGAGVKYFFANYLAVRADARQLGVIENASLRKNYEIGVGFSYYFGKERIKKIAALPIPEKKNIVVLEDVSENGDKIKKPSGSETEKIVAVVTETVSQDVLSTAEQVVHQPITNEIVKKFSIVFDNNSSYLKPDNSRMLKESADILNSSIAASAQIDGHSDSVGKISANMILSAQRAQNVQKRLVDLGVNPNQLSMAAHGPTKPVADNATSEGKQKNRRVDVFVRKPRPFAKLQSEQELQLEADRIENERLRAEILAKSRIHATLVFQEASGAVAVNSTGTLAFEIVNTGLNTEDFRMILSAPTEFDGVMTRANRPDEQITILHLAPGETFKGHVLFRIPAGMVDGQKTTITLKAVSTKFSDVFYQKEIVITASAPVVRVVTRLDKHTVSPGERLRYRLTVLNAGSASARKLSLRLQFPPQFKIVGATGAQYIQEPVGTVAFTIDSIGSGALTEIYIDLKVLENSTVGQELVWNGEIIDGSLQRRAKFNDRTKVIAPN